MRLREIYEHGGIGIERQDQDEAYENRRALRDIEDDAEQVAREQCEADVKDSDWWAERLGEISIATEAAATLARCMANLDAACNGCPISRDAVLTSLSILQKQAKADALDVARLA